jgi:protein CpxP
MRTNKQVILTAALAVGAILALAGFAYGGGPDSGHHRPGFGFGHHRPSPEKIQKFIAFKVNDTLDDLKATEAQRQEVNAVKDQLFEQAKSLFAGRQDLHEQFAAQWNSEQPDAKQVHALIDQRADELRAFAHSAADSMIKVHGVLTPEQRAQLSKEFAAEHAGR